MKTKNTQLLRPSVELHVEELVLDGSVSGSGDRIGAALERELTRLLSEQGVAPALTQVGEVALLDGGSFDVGPGSNSERTGAHLARTIHGRLYWLTRSIAR